MKLFSWFIKANNKSKAKKESLATSGTKEIENKLNDKENAFNNNTMWPIAKVKTTAVIINNLNMNEHQQSCTTSNESDSETDGKTDSVAKVVKTNLVTITLGHD